MDGEGDLSALMLVMIYLVIGVRLCTLALECQQEQEDEEHQEFKLSEEDAEDMRISALATAAAQRVLRSSSCVVCLEEFREGDLCRRLRCHHTFHPCCIQSWLNKGRSKTCPLCRMKFSPQEEEEELDAFSHV